MLRKYGGVHGVAVEITERIKRKKLDLEPIRYFERLDGLSGKTRLLGMESPMEQCMDYVAVCALMPLFEAKIGPFQCASIPGRGQIYGKCALEKWVRRDWEHSQKYIKADIYHCYNSITADVAYKFLYRDIHKNKTLLWFASALLEMFKHGFSIGSYLSQYLCNYLLSYAYHFACEQLYKERRGKRKRLCWHVLFYMDDMILLGADKRDLNMAMQKLAAFLKTNIGLEIKPGSHVKSVAAEGIDMMGYVIRRERTTIRTRVFLRARRQFLRAGRKLTCGKRLTMDHARKLISYRGFFTNSNSYLVSAKLDVYRISKEAKKTISYFTKKEVQKNELQKLLCAGT